ncbi:MAG: hypothetical protein RBT64_02195, partial [Trichloromonas sp.]|nr:hypothetical protein [Trichloromonas sp.]
MRLSMRPNLIGPLLLPVYWVMILTEILIMGLLAVSFNLLLGYTGLLSFGHGAFFGLGAYTCALLLQAGFFSVRLDEIFSAMITLGMGMLFFPIAHNWLAVTGGSDGLPVFALPVLNLAGREFTFYAPNSMYYLV